MDFTKMIALDRATFNDLALWLAQYIKAAFEKYPQARAAVMPHWGQVPASQLAQSTWIVLIRDTPYAGWEYFDPPVQVDVSGHFASLPARIGLRVDVYEKGLVVTGVCKDNQALGFFAELMKAMEDAWPRVADSLDTSLSSLSALPEDSRLKVKDDTESIEPVAAQAGRDEDTPKIGALRLTERDPDDPNIERRKQKLHEYLERLLVKHQSQRQAEQYMGISRTNLERWRKTFPEVEQEVRAAITKHK